MGRDPVSVEEALARARGHGRAAVSELLAAAHALLDAAALAGTGRAAGHTRGIAELAGLLEEWRGSLSGGPGDAAPLLAAVADALEQEIARWELRARREPEARAVLRAFLGLRELLWEFGVRPAPADGAAPRDGDPSEDLDDADAPDGLDAREAADDDAGAERPARPRRKAARRRPRRRDGDARAEPAP